MQGERNDSQAGDMPDQDTAAGEDWQLVQRLREGDAAAGHMFVQQQYPGVYQYLLYLTGRPELAEDLTQETFLQAWRRLDSFAGRAPLRLWLHRIACREFLQAVRRPRPVVPLEEVAEAEEPVRADWAEAMALREAIGELPPDQQQVVVLHYLQGYDCQEIGQILRAPAGTVKYWLSLARTHLQRLLGEGDLPYLNEAAAPMHAWSWLPLDRMHALVARLTKEETMERREFLRHAAVGAAGLMLPEAEKEVVDSRLTKKVTLAVKGAALSEVCELLRADTGIHLVAGPSVADEKVTVFCQKLPLREVMRQFSRPFGYAWLRSGTPGEYRYELAQDLRSQLLEEELRNRDRNAALVALEQEIEQYRPYLGLSPDEALSRAKTAPKGEKRLLEKYAGVGWGPIQMYFRLTPPQHAALRAGETLLFSEEPKQGFHPLPKELARGVLQGNRTWHVLKLEDGSLTLSPAGENPRSLPLTAVPELRAQMSLTLRQSELGQFTLDGASAVLDTYEGGGPYAVSPAPKCVNPRTGPVNSRLVRDPALRQMVSVQPEPSCNVSNPSSAASREEGVSQGEGEPRQPKVTTADVLEAVHQATRLPIVADFYTRLHAPESVSVINQPLSEGLDQLAQAMRLRWNKEEEWLQFRGLTYYHDRMKEVPNRQLSRWASARRQQTGTRGDGGLTLDQLVEIAQLTDDQLDGAEMREGAVEWWGLKEWVLLRARGLRSHARFLAQFTPAQRQAMQSPSGLLFGQMSLSQQQGFLSHALGDAPLRSFEELSGATLRVDYTRPGGFQWHRPGGFEGTRWIVTTEPGPPCRRLLMPPVRERTREAALAAARRAFPPVSEAMVQAARKRDKQMDAARLIPQPEQIYPSELDLVVVYIPGTATDRPIRVVRVTQDLRLEG